MAPRLAHGGWFDPGARTAAAGIRYAVHYSGRSRSALALVDEIGAASLHLSDDGTRLDVVALLGSLDPMTTIYACGPTRLDPHPATSGDSAAT